MAKVQESTQRTVVKIEAYPNASSTNPFIGTGFLVSRDVQGPAGTRRMFFLVTNKHVIGDWDLTDGSITKYYDFIDVYVYRSSSDKYKSIRIKLVDGGGSPVKELLLHKNKMIDVAVLAIDKDLAAESNVNANYFDVSYLRPFDKVLVDGPEGIGLGDQVFALGYPLGITSSTNNLPIVKSGVVASLPGEEISIKQKGKNRKGTEVLYIVEGKIILVDGIIVPGNSGGLCCTN